MKSTEIQVGTEYAYADRPSSITRHKAKILAGPITKQVPKRGYGTRPATVFEAEVTWYDNTPKRVDVQARNLVETWADYTERNRLLRLQAKRSRDALAEARRERAKVIVDIVALLEAAGEPVEVCSATFTGAGGDYAVAADSGLHLFADDQWIVGQFMPRFVAPRAGALWTYYVSGTMIPVKATEYLALLRGASVLARM